MPAKILCHTFSTTLVALAVLSPLAPALAQNTPGAINTPATDDGIIGAIELLASEKEAKARRLPEKFPLNLVVIDENPDSTALAGYHVRPAGKPFSVKVNPMLRAGLPQGHNIASFEVTPVGRLWTDASAELAHARQRLLAVTPKNTSAAAVANAAASEKEKRGIVLDFRPPSHNPAGHQDRAINIDLAFNVPVALTWLQLDGQRQNPANSALSAITLILRTPDGQQTEHPLHLERSGWKWKTTWMDASMSPVKSLTLRIAVTGKIRFDNLDLLARQPGGANKAREWNDMTATATWRDATGRSLAPAISLAFGRMTDVPSPPPPLHPGYYGLFVETAKDGFVIHQKETGFGIVPADQYDAALVSSPKNEKTDTTKNTPAPVTVPPRRSAVDDSLFGMTHHNLNDPWLRPAWSKTLVVTKNVDAKTGEIDDEGWRASVAKVRSSGCEDLPMFTRAVWQSANDQPVQPEQLARIRDYMRHRTTATPDVLFYELGLEENLSYRRHRATATHMWTNLAAKARAAREGAGAANPKIQFGYQIAEFDFRSMEEFIKSPAYREFQFISLHPYAWETFPMPDEWMTSLISRCRGFMQEAGREIPIWFTEIGAPHNGNPGGFFGYPQNGILTNGLSRENYATFMTRCHVIAASLGIRHLFWYNYQDSAEDIFYAERHFGLRDTWGFPKPAYIAYANMTRLLEGRKYAGVLKDGDLVAHRFEPIPGGETIRHGKGTTWVVWRRDKNATTAPWPVTALPAKIKQAVDNYGAPLPIEAGKVIVGARPTYLIGE